MQWLGEHLPTLLHRNDAMGMAAGVEARFPFLDEELIRFGINLPVSAKITPTRHVCDWKHPFLQDKAIVRRVAARRLPADVAQRRKVGFPMYGHQHVRFTPAFWAGGYVADLLGLPREAIDYLDSNVDPYLVAKLASVEVFGHLFAFGNTVEATTLHLQRSARTTGAC